MSDPAKELMLERRKHIQHRGWLLRKSHQPDTAERAGHRRRALLWRAVMESVALDEDRLVSYSDASITENTRDVLGSTKKGARSQIPPTSPIG